MPRFGDLQRVKLLHLRIGKLNCLVVMNGQASRPNYEGTDRLPKLARTLLVFGLNEGLGFVPFRGFRHVTPHAIA